MIQCEKADEGAAGGPDDRALTPEAARQLRELAHELRNPLNALSSVAQIFKDERLGPLPNDAYRRYADLALDATQRMIALCDRLVADPTAGREAAEPAAAPAVGSPAVGSPAGAGEPRRVGEVISGVADFFGPMAEERHVDLQVDIAPSVDGALVDGDLLTSALNNLVANAIKFTPAGGRVSVVARRDPTQNVMVMVVSDTGIGIDPEQLAQIMEGAGGPTRKTIGVHGDHGSGMGLFMVRRGLQLMGGSLEMRSKPGLGTTAVVRLPIRG